LCPPPLAPSARRPARYTAGRPRLLAGDFNAWPTRHPALHARRGNTQPTHPAAAPKRTIDYVIAPATWQLFEYRVLDTEVSDHRPVFARFRCPRAECGSPVRGDHD